MTGSARVDLAFTAFAVLGRRTVVVDQAIRAEPGFGVAEQTERLAIEFGITTESAGRGDAHFRRRAVAVAEAVDTAAEPFVADSVRKAVGGDAATHDRLARLGRARFGVTAVGVAQALDAHAPSDVAARAVRALGVRAAGARGGLGAKLASPTRIGEQK